MLWKVNWDNGSNACGTFPQTFESEEAAQQFADDWSTVMNLMAGIDPDDGEAYFAEPIEVENESDPEGEGWDPVGDLTNAGLSRGHP